MAQGARVVRLGLLANLRPIVAVVRWSTIAVRLVRVRGGRSRRFWRLKRKTPVGGEVAIMRTVTVRGRKTRRRTDNGPRLLRYAPGIGESTVRGVVVDPLGDWRLVRELIRVEFLTSGRVRVEVSVVVEVIHLVWMLGVIEKMEKWGCLEAG